MPINDAELDFHRIFESIPGSYIILYPDLTVAAVSDGYLQTTMVKRENLVGKFIFDIFPDNPDGKSRNSSDVRKSFEKVFRTGTADELPIIKYDVQRPAEKGGGFEERFWKLATFPGFGFEGKVAYIIHRVEDITDQIRLETRKIEQDKINAELENRTERIEREREIASAALEDATMRLESALKAGEIGTWTWDIVNNRVVADKNLAVFFSVSEDDAASGQLEKYLGSIHPEDRQRVDQLIAETLAGSDTFEAEYRLIDPNDGAIRWIVARGRVLRDSEGKPTQLPGVVIDITERKRIDEELFASNERFQLITRATNDAIWDWNLQTNEVWWNQSVQTLFGYDSAQVEPTSVWWYEHIHPNDRERVVNGIHEVIDEGGENWSAEYRFLCADDSYKYVYDRGFAIHREGQAIRMLGAMQDVSARREAEEAFIKSQERLQLVLDASQLGLWYCDLPFDVLNWSELTKEHFWLPPEAIVTIDDFYNLIHPEDRERTRAAIDKSIIDRTHYDIEYRTVNPSDSRVKWIRAIGRGFYDKNNDPYRFDGITIDISSDKQTQTEREQLLASEKNARAEAENANRLKDEFLATLSHELRTPLSSILGWSKMLKAGQVKENQVRRAIETIDRNARSQAQLIEDILDVSRIISGKLRLNIKTVDISAVIETAIESVQPAAKAKGIRLRKFLDNGVLTSGDADRLQQIIWNLLSNAIKFTPPEGRVEIRLEKDDSNVVIKVSDNGYGIEADILPFIFERFRQSDSSTTRQHGGLGLGLAIVRHLVELHGGTVRANSNGRDQGAVFTVRFPQTVPSSFNQTFSDTGELELKTPVENKENEFVTLPEIENLRVLLVDDEPDIRELLRIAFEKCGTFVTEASSFAEAFEALKSQKFDILVSDIGMPGHDGYELIKSLRELPESQNGRIPAIALTAYARLEDRLRALSAGFQLHVPKPVEPAELIAAVAGLASWNRQKK